MASRLTANGHAACWYSLIRPPRTLRRQILATAWPVVVAMTVSSLAEEWVQVPCPVRPVLVVMGGVLIQERTQVLLPGFAGLERLPQLGEVPRRSCRSPESSAEGRFRIG